MTVADWLMIVIPVVFAGGFACGRRWTWRQHTRGEHAFYGKEVSATRIGGNDPISVAECVKRAKQPRTPVERQRLVRRFALRTSTTVTSVPQ